MADAAVVTLSNLLDDFIRETFAFNPALAARLGLHQHDGKIADYRPRPSRAGSPT